MEIAAEASATTNNNNGAGNLEIGSGYLEIAEKGFGFLRSPDSHFHPKPTDIFVTPDTIKKSFLREGCFVEGPIQPPHRGNSSQLKAVDKVNGLPFAEYTKSVRFENLTTIDPVEKFKLETTPELLETRVRAQWVPDRRHLQRKQVSTGFREDKRS